MSFGIVTFNLGGGDTAVAFVDAERWEQIRDAHAAFDEKDPDWQTKLTELIDWLASPDEKPDPDRFEGAPAPARKGKLLATLYTQTFVIERPASTLALGELLGVLAL